MAAFDAIVVGAGLSGLAATFELLRGGARVALLERSARAGGVVGTREVDGFRFETGPNTVLASAEDFHRLCADLGLDARLERSRAGAKERYLWLDGRLVALPSSPTALLTSSVLSWRGKLRVASEVTRTFHPPADGTEPDLRAFFEERLGPEATTRLAGAFVRGVYAAELEELGAASAFPKMWSACIEHGGLVRGLAARRKSKTESDTESDSDHEGSEHDLVAFPGGFQELVDALARAAGSALELGCAVERIARVPEGWQVHAGGSALTAAQLVLACPAHASAELLARSSLLPDAVAELRRITHARVTLVHMGFEERDLPDFPAGFGYLVPPDQTGSDAPRVLGTIFGSNVFERRAPQGCIAVTSFYRTDTVERWAAGTVAAEAAEDLRRALRMRAAPTPRVVDVLAWEGVIPRYAPGHRARNAELQRRLAGDAPGLRLAGCHTGGVSVDQVIARGRAIARSVLAAGVPR
jgi:oxygen-dependent protoporphyrinogen oxidase